MRKISLSCLLFVLYITAPVHGREIYVDNRAGDDRFTGVQQQNTPEQTGPVRTLGKALSLAMSGDTIVLKNNDVPYRESVSLVGGRHSGTAGQPFTIRGNGAVLDGSKPIDPKAWEPCQGGVFMFRPRRTSYQQLFIDDLPASQVATSTAARRPPKLGPLQWCMLNSTIYFCVEKAKLPQDYYLSCADQQTGITLYRVDCVLIDGLTVQGFQLDGVNLVNGARNVTLSNITCRGNGRSGMSIGGASSVQIARCALGNNGTAQLLTLPYSRASLHDTLLLDNTAPGWVDRGGTVYVEGKAVEGGLERLPAE
ncbi:MAG: right-handed parallel beta-helix repeat-containing protein [Pirellulales bacterium]|nr:right-handed parallel beta-helix repeat-containing protein [Pirellulales bacterium]